ncbi:MAG: MATE family efflux transporter [Gemmatimonadota bacterium]|nr:MATE family efflux transporter [Gemmatimonadota bacterium]
MTTDLFHSEGVFIAAPELKEKTHTASPIPDGHSGTYGPYNGAGKLDRVKAAWHKSLWYGFIMMLFGTAIVLIFARPLIVLFTADEAVIGPGIQYLRISALVFFAYVVLFTTVALLQGLKKPMYAIWIGVFRQIVAPVPVFWLLSVALQWELLGIWWGVFFIVWSSALFTLWYGKRVLDNAVRGQVSA